jgi:GT2 family glycosyltransferase
VNLDKRVLLETCLRSLEEAMRPHDLGEVIVVDNGSRDGSVAMVHEKFPDVRVVELDKNTGFAGGVAAGIRSSRGDWILCINNDAAVAPDAVVELLRVAESGGERVGSVAALMVFADRPGTINSAGIEVDRLGVASDRLLGQPVETSETEPMDVFGASAGAALYRRDMLDEIPFDETFFAYYEDVDVAWRARMRGWRCLFAPGAVVRHDHSATSRHGSSFKYYWSGRNRIRVLARNATGSQLRRYGFAMLAFDLVYVAVALVAARSTAPIRGRYDGLRSWRADRGRGEEMRAKVELTRFLGFGAAYRRFRGA